MGGRGSSSGGGGGGIKATANNLIDAGGRRWQKNGNDRIYLQNAIKVEDGASRSVRNTFSSAISSAYYDVKADQLVYKKTSNPYVNNRIESEFERLKRRKK